MFPKLFCAKGFFESIWIACLQASSASSSLPSLKNVFPKLLWASAKSGLIVITFLYGSYSYF